MRTNIEIDDQVLAKAQMLSNIKTKKAVVERALRLYVTIETQKKFRNLWGNLAIDDDLNQ